MAKTSKKNTPETPSDTATPKVKFWELSKQNKLIIGSLLVLFSIGLLIAFVSFFLHGQEDQSAVNSITDRNEVVQNWLGKIGAFLADALIYKGFGIASFLFVRLFFLTGLFLFLDLRLKKLKNIWFWDLFLIVILSVLFGFFATSVPELGGTVGYELNLFFQDYIGKTGTLLVLIFGILIYLIFKIKISPEKIQNIFHSTKEEIKDEIANNPFPKETSNAYNLEEFAINHYFSLY